MECQGLPGTEEAYCETRRVNGGKWWHHGPHHEESVFVDGKRSRQLSTG